MTIQQRQRGMVEAGREWGLPVWLRLIFPAALLFIAMLRYVRPLGDPDTFWHVRTGQWLRETWQFHGPDPFTTTAALDWTMHEWLPQLLMGWVDDTWGLAGVAWLMLAGLAILMTAIYWVCRQWAPVLVSGFVTGATIAAMSSSISPRPQMVTFIFCVLTAHAWLATAQDGRPRWWLVAVTWIWASSHGMWFVGVVAGAFVLVGATLDRVLTRQQVARLTVLLILQVLAASLGPAGVHVITAPFRVSSTTALIAEWRPASLLDVAFAIFIMLAGLAVVIWVRRTSPVPWTHVLLLALAVGFALLGLRLVAVGAALLTPVLAWTLHQALGYKREWWMRREVVALAAGAAAGLAVAGLMIAGMARPVAWGPQALVPQLQGVDEGEIVCNNYGLGGWLIYYAPHLYPVVDGRAEVFEPQHVADSMAMEAGVGWREFVDEQGCSIALLSQSAPAVELLLTTDEWRLVGEADGYALLTRG